MIIWGFTCVNSFWHSSLVKITNPESSRRTLDSARICFVLPHLREIKSCDGLPIKEKTTSRKSFPPPHNTHGFPSNNVRQFDRAVWPAIANIYIYIYKRKEILSLIYGFHSLKLFAYFAKFFSRPLKTIWILNDQIRTSDGRNGLQKLYVALKCHPY